MKKKVLIVLAVVLAVALIGAALLWRMIGARATGAGGSRRTGLIRRTLGQDRLVVIGHSFGAFIAALYAAEFPERVSALVLVAPADVVVMPSPDGGLFELIRRRLFPAMKSEYETYLAEYFDFRRAFSRSEPESSEFYSRSDALRRVSAPVLVVHGADDLQAESTSRRFAAFFPKSRFAVIRGARHLVFDQQPEAFASAVRVFLGV